MENEIEQTGLVFLQLTPPFLGGIGLQGEQIIALHPLAAEKTTAFARALGDFDKTAPRQIIKSGEKGSAGDDPAVEEVGDQRRGSLIGDLGALFRDIIVYRRALAIVPVKEVPDPEADKGQKSGIITPFHAPHGADRLLRLFLFAQGVGFCRPARLLSQDGGAHLSGRDSHAREPFGRIERPHLQINPRRQLRTGGGNPP